MPGTDSEQWYTRPVFFVSDIDKSLDHYQSLLGFSQAWNYREGNRTIVVQLNRGAGCELILTEDAERAGKSRVFISLDTDELESFQAELNTRNVPVVHSWWGYPVIVVNDPDGNEMLFPLEP